MTNDSALSEALFKILELQEAWCPDSMRLILIWTALQGNTRLLVDAEHTYMQTAIDALTIRLQQRCNRHEPVVINTYQVRRHHGTFAIDSMQLSR